MTITRFTPGVTDTGVVSPTSGSLSPLNFFFDSFRFVGVVRITPLQRCCFFLSRGDSRSLSCAQQTPSSFRAPSLFFFFILFDCLREISSFFFDSFPPAPNCRIDIPCPHPSSFFSSASKPPRRLLPLRQRRRVIGALSFQFLFLPPMRLIVTDVIFRRSPS